MNMIPKTGQFWKEAKVDSLRPIGENPKYSEAQEKLSKFGSEVAAIRKAIDAENAAWYARQSGASDENAIEVADQLLAGRDLDGRDTPAKLRDLNERLAILRPAVYRQRELVDRIRGELSVEAGKVVQARHRKALAKILEAARQLVSVAAGERLIRGQLLDHGFEVVESITPPPQLATPLILGDESFHDSAISHFVRQLEDLGILP
jgi:hypothetical protein